ncbi:unnamed protein product [Brassica rapa subsp. narinosa]
MTTNFAFTGDDDAASVSSKQLVLLASICSGILMCKLVYDFAAYISPLRFNAYPKLDSKVRMEWNNRGFSTFHAVFVSVASIYLLVISDQFDENVHGDSVVNSTTSLSEAVMGISLGYFIPDLTMIFWHFPTLGGIEYVFHHCLSMFSIILSVTSGQAQFYIFIVLLSEATTPFVNLRWYLDTSGQKCSKAYTLNGIALFLGWLVARILLFIYYFVHMYFHFHQVVKQVFPLGFYSLLTVAPEDGWVVCRVFMKKNLFKVVNDGGSSINSADQYNHDASNNNNNTLQARSFMHGDSPYQLVRNHGATTFELNKPDLSLHQYPPIFHKPPSLGVDYSSGFPRDCESAASEGLQYQQACEPGLEVGTSETVANHNHQQGLGEWSMMDRLVTCHLGNEDSSRGIRFEDGNNNSSAVVQPVPTSNQLSLRSEMDFWGYSK